MVASAKEYLAKNDRTAAVIQLRNALQKNPDLAEARFLLGKSLLETGDLAGAEKELRKAAELKYPPDQVVPALAGMLVARGEYKKAVDEFGTANLASAEGKAELQTTLGKALMALGNADAAKSAFAAARSAQSDYPPALIGEARLKAIGGDMPGALALVETALAKSPTLTEGWQLKGDLLIAQQQLEPALAAYRKAVETKPDFVPAHYMIVSLLMQQGKSEEASKQLEAMKKVAPKHPQTFYLQALMAYRDKNYAAARECDSAAAQGGAEQPDGHAARSADRFPARVLRPGGSGAAHGVAARAESPFRAPPARPDLSARRQARQGD